MRRCEVQLQKPLSDQVCGLEKGNAFWGVLENPDVLVMRLKRKTVRQVMEYGLIGNHGRHVR